MKSPQIEQEREKNKILEQEIIRKIVIKNCDFNNLDEQGTGIFIATSQVVNAPNNASNQSYHVIQSVWSNYTVQIAISLWSNPIKIWGRLKVNGNWNEWTSLH